MRLIHGVREQFSLQETGYKYLAFVGQKQRVSVGSLQTITEAISDTLYYADENDQNRLINLSGGDEAAQEVVVSSRWRFPVEDTRSTVDIFTLSGETRTTVAQVDISSSEKYVNVFLTDFFGVPGGMTYNAIAMNANVATWADDTARFVNLSDIDLRVYFYEIGDDPEDVLFVAGGAIPTLSLSSEYMSLDMVHDQISVDVPEGGSWVGSAGAWNNQYLSHHGDQFFFFITKYPTTGQAEEPAYYPSRLHFWFADQTEDGGAYSSKYPSYLLPIAQTFIEDGADVDNSSATSLEVNNDETKKALFIFDVSSVPTSTANLRFPIDTLNVSGSTSARARWYHSATWDASTVRFSNYEANKGTQVSQGTMTYYEDDYYAEMYVINPIITAAKANGGLMYVEVYQTGGNSTDVKTLHASAGAAETPNPLTKAHVAYYP